MSLFCFQKRIAVPRLSKKTEIIPKLRASQPLYIVLYIFLVFVFLAFLFAAVQHQQQQRVIIPNENLLLKRTQQADSFFTSTCTAHTHTQFKMGIVPNSAPPVIHEYVRWHERSRTCICDRECEMMPKVIVLRCNRWAACGGVGDRIRGANMAFLIAIASRRLFFIDFPAAKYNPFDFTTALWPATVDWRLPKCNSFRDVPHLDWYSKHPQHKVSLPNGQPLNLLDDNVVEKLSPFPQLSLSSNTMANLSIEMIRRMNRRGELLQLNPKKLKAKHILRLISHVLFRPSEEVMNRMKDYLPEGFEKNGYAAVHIRIGEDVDEKNDARFRNMNNHSKIASALLKCAMTFNGENNRRVFLASDSQSMKQVFYQVAQHHQIEVFSIGGKAMHIAHPLGTQSAKVMCENFINVFADLYFLGSAHSLVMSGSGFGRAAFYMGNASVLYMGYKDDHAVCHSA